MSGEDDLNRYTRSSYNLCDLSKYAYDEYLNANCKTQFLVICGKMLEFMFKKHTFPNLRGIVVSKFCTCRVSLNDNTTVSHKQFPRLCGIKMEQEEGKYENYLKGHTPAEMYPATKLYYFCERNKEKIHCAMLLFYVMRKQYPLIDRNVAKRICREYIELDYNLPCREELYLYDVWQPEALTKKRKMLSDENIQRQAEIVSLEKEFFAIELKLREKRLERNETCKKIEILNQMLAFSENIGKNLKN